MINRLGEMQNPGPDPASLQLYETLSKVRSVQSELLSKADTGVSVQEECNRLLQQVVDSLESAKQILSNDGGGLMGGRMAELCDELAVAVSGLITVQSKLSDTSSMDKLDCLLKSVASSYRAEGGKVVGGASVPAKPRRVQPRRDDSDSPSSELELDNVEAAGSKPGEAVQQDEEMSEVPDEVLISPVARQKM